MVSAVNIMIMVAHPRMFSSVKHGWTGILSVFYLVLVGCLILFGVEVVDGLILCLQLQMVLGSVAQRIVLVLRYLQQILLILSGRFIFLHMKYTGYSQ
jgi:hypothetical protein